MTPCFYFNASSLLLVYARKWLHCPRRKQRGMESPPGKISLGWKSAWIWLPLKSRGAQPVAKSWHRNYIQVRPLTHTLPKKVSFSSKHSADYLICFWPAVRLQHMCSCLLVELRSKCLWKLCMYNENMFIFKHFYTHREGSLPQPLSFKPKVSLLVKK